jgi:hypothetical protein
MSDLIRQLLEARLPSEVIEQLGDYLGGLSNQSILSQQAGELGSRPDVIDKMQMMNAGLRASPMVNSLQLDR